MTNRTSIAMRLPALTREVEESVIGDVVAGPAAAEAEEVAAVVQGVVVMAEGVEAMAVVTAGRGTRVPFISDVFKSLRRKSQTFLCPVKGLDSPLIRKRIILLRSR